MRSTWRRSGTWAAWTSRSPTGTPSTSTSSPSPTRLRITRSSGETPATAPTDTGPHMKKELHPALFWGIVLVLVVLIGGYGLKTVLGASGQGRDTGFRPP